MVMPVPRRLIVAACLTALAGCGAKTNRTATQTASGIGHRATGVARPHPVPLLVRAAPAGRLPVPLQDPATTRAGAGARAMGGLNAADTSVADVLAVSRSGQARAAGQLPAAVHDAAAATIGATTYLFGGGDRGITSDRIVAVGSPNRTAGRLPRPASDVSAAVLGDTAYVVGGYDGASPLDTIVAWRPGAPARVVGHLPRPARYTAVAAVGGRLLIAGGTLGTGALTDVVAFDPATGGVRKLGRLPIATSHAAGAQLSGSFLVLGGRDSAGAQLRSILAIDPRTGHVRHAGRLPQPLSDMGAASLPGRVLVVGGRDSAGRAQDSVLSVTSRPRAAAAALPRPLAGRNVYAADGPTAVAAVARHALDRIYVPETLGNAVDEIDPATFRVVRRFSVPTEPQHVTPSWDLKTLWVDSDKGNTLTPIDPRTGTPGRPRPVADPYNLYFTPDGRHAIVVAERMQRLDFRDPHTLRLQHSTPVTCPGIDHMDFTADGRLALASCEFSGRLAVLDVRREQIVRYVSLRPGAMPQDVRLGPDGRWFYVADMASGGVWLVRSGSMRVGGFIRTGAGAHGFVLSRDARHLFISNRGEGTISVLSLRTNRLIARWRIPGGGSPDMGGVSASGRVLWLSGRWNSEVYAISTRTGRLLRRISVGPGPHGLSVWPQPGRYSLGHTGTLR
jgi:DNA-binding beta-propeller fold protein YncE